MTYLKQHRRILTVVGLLILAALGLLVYSVLGQEQTPTFQLLHQDTLIAADLWSDQPEILSAGYGFDAIIGVNGGEAEVRAVGGTWNPTVCSNGAEPPRNVLTSSAETDNLDMLYDHTTVESDGLPVVFSYPVLPSTVNHSDFRVTLNDGSSLIPDAASIYPNWEYNERHVVVIFGDFGNRGLIGEPDALYTVKVEVVADESPLMLVGPEGPVSALGLFKESENTPYASGPYLVGAKLNRFSEEGEGGPRFLRQTQPNDGRALYGEEAQYRLRMYTSGGFSPDGVLGIKPTEFERFFRLHATGPDGQKMLIERVGQVYTVQGGTLEVVGLAELGLPASDEVVYDDCYVEDRDNYIDVILKGDEAAMRSLTHLEIPATGDYDPLYNPGGPGSHPSEGVRYTAPGPADLEPIILALDDPLTVTYEK
jgi:hypothetical protein